MRRVLNTKIYVEGDARKRSLDSFSSMVENEAGDLDFDFETQLRDDDRVEVRGVGDDAEAVLNRLSELFGEYESQPEEGERYLGSFEAWGDDGFMVDIGREVRVPTDALEELGTGSPEQIRERFGVVQHTPLEVVWEGDSARLSEEQVDELWSWRKGDDGGRLNVNSATRAEVRSTVNRAGHADDIITVERLGLLEQSVVCAPGTEPPGLLANVGEYIRGEMKCVVS